MIPKRRQMVSALIGASALWFVRDSLAQGYPTKPIKIIVPVSPGGIVDVEVRRIAGYLSRSLGQPVVIENRPGASNTIGTSLGAQAKPDGYTLTWGSTSAISSAPAMMAKLPYDPLKDFEPVIQFGQASAILVVNPALDVRNLKELIALAKRKPGQLQYASNGPAASLHVMGELLKQTFGLDILHVPYKAAAQSLISILANETQLGFDFPVTAAAHVKAGKLVPIMLTGKERVPILPGVPTAAELGFPQLEVTFFGGMLAPAGTPREIVLRLNNEMQKILRLPEIADALSSTGTTAVGGTAEEFRKAIAIDIQKWKDIIATTGVRME